MGTTIDQRETGAHDEVAYRVRHQNLARRRETDEPRSEVDGDSPERHVRDLDFSRVYASSRAHTECLVLTVDVVGEANRPGWLRSSAVFCTHVGSTSCQLKTPLLLDHTSRPQQDGRGNREAERFCRLRIEDQVDFRWLFNGEVRGPGPLQDLVDVAGAPPP